MKDIFRDIWEVFGWLQYVVPSPEKASIVVAPINNSNKSVIWHHLATQFLLLLMVTMGDGFTDCSVGISKVLKHQQHAYLVSQVTNKLDLYKLKLETKMDKIKLWELDEGSSNANSTEFKIIKQLSTSLSWLQRWNGNGAQLQRSSRRSTKSFCRSDDFPGTQW